MSQIETALHNNAQLVRLLRDEIGLQAHLLKEEARHRLAELDAGLDQMKAHLERAAVAGADVRREAEVAAGLLADSLREGYGRIRDALRS